MTLDDINKELKLLNTKKIMIEKLMKKPEGHVLNQAWLTTDGEINELQELVNNCDFIVE